MLFKRAGSTNWWIRFEVAGTKVKQSAGTDDRTLAEEFEQKRREQVWRQHKFGDRGAISFRTCAERWLAETQKRTKHQDKLTLDWFCATNEFADAPISAIDTDGIQVMRQALLDEGKAKATVDRYMSVLRALLRKAQGEWAYLERVPKVPMFNARPPEPRYLTPEEYGRLRSELPPHLQLAADFAVSTGLRMRSQLSLRWRQVDLRGKSAWVAGTKMKAGKTHGFPLSSKALATLRALKKIDPPSGDDDWVFTWKGRPIDDCNTLAFQKAVKRAKVQPCNWHTLRHTFASWAVQSGVSLHQLMRLGPWASFVSVLRYAHLNPTESLSAVEQIEKFQRGQTKARLRKPKK